MGKNRAIGNPSSYELQIIKILKKSKVSFQREKTFRDLRGGKYRYDFYLPNYKGRQVLIEVDSEIHYSYIKFFHKDRAGFDKTRARDRRKNSYALSRSLELYRIPYDEIEEMKVVEDILNPRFFVRTEDHNDKIILRRKER